jgi:hypothetical protein
MTGEKRATSKDDGRERCKREQKGRKCAMMLALGDTKREEGKV